MEPTNFKRLQQQWKMSEHIEEAMAQSVEGNLELEAMLQVVRKNVVRQGALTDQAIAFVQLDGEPFELTSALEELLENLQKNPEKLHPNALRDWQKEQVLAFLDKELAEIGERIKMCQEDEIAVAEAHKAAAMVPSREVMDRIGHLSPRLRIKYAYFYWVFKQIRPNPIIAFLIRLVSALVSATSSQLYNTRQLSPGTFKAAT
jgi:hypothetical protein